MSKIVILLILGLFGYRSMAQRIPDEAVEMAMMDRVKSCIAKIPYKNWKFKKFYKHTDICRGDDITIAPEVIEYNVTDSDVTVTRAIKRSPNQKIVVQSESVPLVNETSLYVDLLDYDREVSFNAYYRSDTIFLCNERNQSAIASARKSIINHSPINCTKKYTLTDISAKQVILNQGDSLISQSIIDTLCDDLASCEDDESLRLLLGKTAIQPGPVESRHFYFKEMPDVFYIFELKNDKLSLDDYIIIRYAQHDYLCKRSDFDTWGPLVTALSENGNIAICDLGDLVQMITGNDSPIWYLVDGVYFSPRVYYDLFNKSN